MVKRLFLTVIKKWSKNGWRTKKNGRLKISNNEDADMHVAGRSNAEQKCAKVGGRTLVRAGGRTGGQQACIVSFLVVSFSIFAYSYSFRFV